MAYRGAKVDAVDGADGEQQFQNQNLPPDDDASGACAPALLGVLCGAELVSRADVFWPLPEEPTHHR